MVPLIIYVKMIAVAVKTARLYNKTINSLIDDGMTVGDDIVIIVKKDSLTNLVKDMDGVIKMLEEKQDSCLVKYS